MSIIYDFYLEIINIPSIEPVQTNSYTNEVNEMVRVIVEVMASNEVLIPARWVINVF